MKSIKLFLISIIILISIYFASAAEIDLLGLTLDVKESGIDVDNVNITIEIYDAATGGNLIYNSSGGFENNVSNGKVDIILGDDTSGYELNLTYGTTYYMDLVINGSDIDFNGIERQKFPSTVGNITSSRLNLSDTLYTNALIPYANLSFDLGSQENYYRSAFIQTLTLANTLDSGNISDVYLFNTGDTASGDYTFDSPTLHIDSGLNFIGIRTTTPANALNVVGDGNFTGALYVGGVQITADSNVSGGGTPNYIVKFLDTATIGNSLIYDDGTLVGIDTTAPQGKLHIANSTTLTVPWINVSDGGNGIKFVIDNAGLVGIGRYPTGDLLEVAGSILATQNLTIQGAAYLGDLQDSLINTTHIAADTILAGDIAAGAVETSEILDRTITADDIADSSINTTLILDRTLLSDDLADSSINTTLVIDRTLLSDDLADSSVNSTIILDNDITTEDILLNTINGSDIAIDSEFIIANLSVTDNITAQFNFTTVDSLLVDYIYADTETFTRIDNLTILQDLRVLGSSYLGSFIIKDDLSVGQTNITSTFTGIGSINPLFLLHLNISDDLNETITELLVLEKTNLSTGAGDGYGSSILFRLADDTGEMENASMISGILEDVSNGTERGALVFYTGYGDVNGIISNLSLAEAMRITGAGNVGIGTTAPAQLLNVIGATNITGDVFLSISGLSSCSGKLITSADGNITCGVDASGGGMDYTNIAMLNETDQRFIGNVTFADNFTVDGDTFYVDASANRVGIGTTSPSSLLDISGGNLTITNTTATDFPYILFSPGGYIYDNGTALVIGHN